MGPKNETKPKHSLTRVLLHLTKRIDELEQRIKILENNNEQVLEILNR